MTVDTSEYPNKSYTVQRYNQTPANELKTIWLASYLLKSAFSKKKTLVSPKLTGIINGKVYLNLFMHIYWIT